MKILISILLMTLTTFSFADSLVDKMLEDGLYSHLPQRVKVNDLKYPLEIPMAVYLMSKGEEDLAIKLIEEEVIEVSIDVIYKGNMYTTSEWAGLMGYNKYVEAAKGFKVVNASKEEIIQRNKKSMFSNTPRIQSDINRELKILKRLKEKTLQEILNDKEGKDKRLLSLLVKMIIDGNNDAANLIIDHIDDVNSFNEQGISPLMATGFGNVLPGGNVEFANILIYDHGAKVDLVNHMGMSAVHTASAGDAYKTLIALMNKGAKFMNPDKVGKISLDYAIKANATKSLFILERAITTWKGEKNSK
jgi:hypothetical protein